MILELTRDEADELRALLDRNLSNLYAEISHTDNPAFRAGLREQRALLRAVRERLDAKLIIGGIDA